MSSVDVRNTVHILQTATYSTTMVPMAQSIMSEYYVLLQGSSAQVDCFSRGGGNK